jgi:hypothetical protein
MRKIIVLAGILLLLSLNVFATNARVESMGKSSTFFMDDVSIYDNPANVNIYPNFLIGEAGHMIEFKDTNTNFRNQDPAEPYGGGILSFSLNKDKNAETRYPMVCIGAMMNHKNEMVDVLLSAANANHHIIPTPKVPNSDFFIGYTAANGTMVGGHFYADVQDITVPGSNLWASRNDLKDQGITTGNIARDSALNTFVSGTAEWTSEVYRGDLGVNMPLTQNMDLEVSGGLGLLQYSGPTNALADFNIDSYDATDVSYFLNARLFSTLLSLNGEIVPIFKLKQINVRKYAVLEWATGLGANVTLDRGFFWAGAEFIRNSTDQPQGASTGQIKNTTTVHIPLSFGIERNVVWEWLVLRVGFRKIIWGTSSNQNDFAMLETNPEADMTVNDHVGGGIGINIEEKLKIDAVMAEDFLYKWGNLISGNEHHVFTRITATYSF